MTISSSLAAGVAGLNANATRLSTIADNIANSATHGYKRVEADFHSMVINGNKSGYSAGGVRATTQRIIDERGPMISTGNATDLAIRGRGFLPVTTSIAMQGGSENYPLKLATTGSFRPNSDGVLTTDTGLVLMGWPANLDGTMPSFPRHTPAGMEPVQINVDQFSGDPTTTMTLGVNLPATATSFDSSGDPETLAIEYYGNLGTSETLDISFTPFIPASGSSNQWTMTITDAASGGTVVGEYTLNFDDSRAAGGSLETVTVLSGGAYDSATGNISLTLPSGPFDFNIGAIGENDGMTQLSDSFAPVRIEKNGSPVGNLTGVEVDANGFVHAVYDAGFTRKIYRIPVVDVPNPNQLISNSNGTYQVSSESGEIFLWDSGTGPAGDILAYAKEESTTDVAAELTDLIQTQRAYSSNAKVIQTVDEMLQETTNIKR